MNAETSKYGQNSATKEHIADFLRQRGEEAHANSLTLVRMKPLEYSIVTQSEVGATIGILNSQHPDSILSEFHIGKSQYGVCLSAGGSYADGKDPQVAEDKPIIVLRLDTVVLDIPINHTPEAEAIGVNSLVLGGLGNAYEFLLKKYEGAFGDPIDSFPYYIRQFTVLDRFNLPTFS